MTQPIKVSGPIPGPSLRIREGSLLNSPKISSRATPFEDSLLQDARTLRKNQTVAEKHFWNIVRKRKVLGFRFLRQKPILSYIVDFYCAELKLVIEIDGGIHDESKEADTIRTKDLETLGIKVIRFTNDQVMNQLPFVIEQLRIEITSHRELPSLILREGPGMGPDKDKSRF